MNVSLTLQCTVHFIILKVCKHSYSDSHSFYYDLNISYFISPLHILKWYTEIQNAFSHNKHTGYNVKAITLYEAILCETVRHHIREDSSMQPLLFYTVFSALFHPTTLLQILFQSHLIKMGVLTVAALCKAGSNYLSSLGLP